MLLSLLLAFSSAMAQVAKETPVMTEDLPDVSGSHCGK
jgi:hypothetical protein